LVSGVAYQATTFRTKIGGGGVWAKGAYKKFGTPYLLLQPLKLAASNFVHSLGLGSRLPKKNFRTKLAREKG